MPASKDAHRPGCHTSAEAGTHKELILMKYKRWGRPHEQSNHQQPQDNATWPHAFPAPSGSMQELQYHLQTSKSVSFVHVEKIKPFLHKQRPWEVLKETQQPRGYRQQRKNSLVLQLRPFLTPRPHGTNYSYSWKGGDLSCPSEG